MVQILHICTTILKNNESMATITAFIRVATTKKKTVKVRFRLRDGRNVQLLYSSNIEVQPEQWDAKREEIKAKVVMNPAEKAHINKAVLELKSLISDIYHGATIAKEQLTSQWLKEEIDRAQHPDLYGTTARRETFFETFARFLETRNLSEVRTRNFKVIYRALQRFEIYKQLYSRPNFKMELDTITHDTLHDFEDFLKTEYQHFTKDEATGKYICNPEYRPIYDAVPETRTPGQRGQNTISDILTKLRTFVLWAIETGETTNNPFKHYSIKECIYGTPYYITIDERNALYEADLSSRPQLAIQRDIFVFQCLIGCRVGDLYKLTPDNIIKGAVEYVPRKTKEGRHITVRVPLNATAKEILERYQATGNGKLLPFISEQKYNVAIKAAFTAAGITRPVTIINPTTREPEIKPINEIASSHLARRCFVGNLYKQVKDPNLVGVLSGHKEGSRAFARYREIDEEMKQDLVNLLV